MVMAIVTVKIGEYGKERHGTMSCIEYLKSAKKRFQQRSGMTASRALGMRRERGMGRRMKICGRFIRRRYTLGMFGTKVVRMGPLPPIVEPKETSNAIFHQSKNTRQNRGEG